MTMTMMMTITMPESIEEAGALLGAAITKCNGSRGPPTAAPKGMHSSFAIAEPSAESELFTRLFHLRQFLRISDKPLAVAPSLLAVLLKLIGVSSSLAAAFQNDTRVTTPPLWSTPTRTLWVDCVVACHVRGTPADLLPATRTMLALAALHPKSIKAAGGTRMAAFQVLQGLFQHVPQYLPPWAYADTILASQRALKSAGYGEPSYRIAAVKTAQAVCTASRNTWITAKPHRDPRLMLGAIEDSLLTEILTLLRLASADKYPEVRGMAATLATIMAPMWIIFRTTPNKPGDVVLDEALTLAYKNLDDEQTTVALPWAEALARGLHTLLHYHESKNESTTTTTTTTPEEVMRFSSHKAITWAAACPTPRKTIAHLVDCFVKAGGEWQATRLGSPFSRGGRAVRLGLSLTLVHFGALQYPHWSQQEELAQIVMEILQMVGGMPFLKIIMAESLDVTSVDTPEKITLFSSSKKSPADAALATLATNRVLREGLVAISSEHIQLTLLRIFIRFMAEADLNPHQLQVCWIETSHLITTLGEASHSSIEDLIPLLKQHLQHVDHGVRHETAICAVAMAMAFPLHGRKFLHETINEVQGLHFELESMTTLDESPQDLTPKKNRFRRKETKKENNSLALQFAIHGQSLVIAVMLRELPQHPGGLPVDFMAMAMSVAERLVRTQTIEHLMKKNPGSVCTCVRAGYGILCGGLSAGPNSMIPHMSLIYGLWHTAGQSVRETNVNLTLDQDLIFLDAALSSLVAFLEHCSELLLEIPDALSRTTMLLEEILPLFLQDGRFEHAPASSAARSRHESAKASIMEAFAWLPPGSYPMIANEVFAFALAHIQVGTEAEVTCSLLPTLVNNEDKILDAKSLSRAQHHWQISGARVIEDNLITLNSEGTHYGERESVFHFQTSTLRCDPRRDHHDLWGSQVLGLLAHDGKLNSPPTPLHKVGTWRKPVSPSCSSKIRLVDAAVQAFSATFGLKDGKEQQSAMLTLESLVPPFLAQLARAFGVNTALIEQDRRTKTKDDNAAIANITAVLLCCLKALPLHEATHDIPIGLGPPWMNKAKDLLLTLLPSTSNIVRRATSEGLALLATLGVTEDAHTLQSTVLRSLDEVMQGNKPDGNPRAIPLEPLSAARAGSLLTLACIQRTAFNIRSAHRARRVRTSQAEKAEIESDGLPTIQMMTRILPLVACHAVGRDAFVVRTYALHAFTLLIAYSTTLTNSVPSEEDKHLLKKGIEMIEDNFLACWTAVSAESDQGQDAGKLAVEASFLSVLLRTMSFVIPHLGLLADTDTEIVDRLSRMAIMIVEDHNSHPVVLAEGFAFFEVLANNMNLLAPATAEATLLSCVSHVMESLTPNLLQIHPVDSCRSQVGSFSSPQVLRAGVLCIKILALNEALNVWESRLPSTLLTLLEYIAGSRPCTAATFYRSLAVSRDADNSRSVQAILEAEICGALHVICSSCKLDEERSSQALARWVLLCRPLIIGNTEQGIDNDDDDCVGANFTRAGATLVAASMARADTSTIFGVSNSCRWQVRCQASRLAASALHGLSANISGSAHFDPCLAVKSLQNMEEIGGRPLPYLAFQLTELLSAASTAVVATVDKSELRHVQGGGISLLREIVSDFGAIRDPDEPGASILQQFSSQILSATKHAITAADGEPVDVSYSLLVAGCETLEMIMKKGLITDLILFKRMIRPILPAAGDLPFAEYGTSEIVNALRPKSSNAFVDRRSLLVPRLVKLSCMARIRDMIENQILSESISSYFIEKTKPFEIGIHSAAAAIDGARLLQLENHCMCASGATISVTESQLDDQVETPKPGLLFAHITDIDNLTKALLSLWAPCAFHAALLLSKHTTLADENTRNVCLAWIEKLLPVLLVGFKDSSRVINQNTRTPVALESAVETMKFCLHGLRSLFATDPCVKCHGELPSIITILSDSVVMPSLSRKPEGISVLIFEELLMEGCKFIHAVTLLDVDDAVNSCLLLALLTPLDAVQQGTITFKSKHVPWVVVSFMKTLAFVIKKVSPKNSLVKAMLQLSLDFLYKSNIPDTVRVGAETLLAACFETDSITLANQQTLARDLAMQGHWDAWCIICGQSEDALKKSIGIVAVALQDLSNIEMHLGAIAALKTILLAATIPSPTINIIMQGAGAQVIGLFKAYGTQTYPYTGAEIHRHSVCSDSMKILMVSYNQLISGDHMLLTSFVTLVFECWVAIIQFNGLPNQSTPQHGADAMLGKISAQAIMHVARTTPTVFKVSMGDLSDHARSILEFAVRSDMSGYAINSMQVPMKKKIDLTSFKK